MDYGEILKRSWRIAWHNRWLWLLALFAGEGGGGGSASFNYRFPTGNTGSSGSTGSTGVPAFPNAGALADAATSWMQAHLGLLLLAAATLVVLLVALLLIGCACEGALVAGSAELDADRPVGLGGAWRLGAWRWLAVLGARLLAGLVLLAVIVPALLFAALAVVEAIGANGGAAFTAGFFAFQFGAVGIVVSVLVSLALELGIRDVVLERAGAGAALGHGWRLMRRRPGAVAILYLILVLVALVYGIVIAIATLLGAVVIGGPAVLLASTNGFSPGLLVPVLAGAVLLVALLVVVSAAYRAFYSTFWTVAWRRLQTPS